MAGELRTLLGREVTFLEDCTGAAVEEACTNPTPGEGGGEGGEGDGKKVDG